MRRCMCVAAVLGCSDPAHHASVPDARVCTGAIGGCAEVPLALAGTWMLTGLHTAVPPYTPLGDISFEVTFTPADGDGCYTAVSSGVPANADARWPVVDGTWGSDSFSAAAHAVIAEPNGELGELIVNWSFCTAPSNGRLQVRGSSSIGVSTPQPGLTPIETFTGTATNVR